MTIVIFTDRRGTDWKVWQAASTLWFHAKGGGRRVLRLAGPVELPDLTLLREVPGTLEELCEQAEDLDEAA